MRRVLSKCHRNMDILVSIRLSNHPDVRERGLKRAEDAAKSSDLDGLIIDGPGFLPLHQQIALTRFSLVFVLDAWQKWIHWDLTVRALKMPYPSFIT